MKRISPGMGMTFISLALLLPALAFASSGSPREQPRTHASKSSPTLRLTIPNVPALVDPALVANEENVLLANLLYSGLVRLDATYRIVPDAATSWSVSADRKTYTFHLRHGIRFSNGDPVQAKDFAFSINRSLNPALKSASAPTYLIDIKGAPAVIAGKAKTVSGVKVLDRYTLQISARWPISYFLMELTYPTSFALDSRILTKLGPADNSSWYKSPVGSGAFRLKSWVANTKMSLVPNKYFSGPTPPLKSISISLSPLPTLDLDLEKYVQHNLDVLCLSCVARTLPRGPGFHETKMLAIDGVYMNLQSKPFKNKDVRRALVLALNRRKIVTSAMGSTVTPFTGYVPIGEAGYYPRLNVQPFDIRRARMALKAAGYANGKNFPATTLYYADDPSNDATAKLARAMARAWHSALNITINTEALRVDTLLTRSEMGQLPLYLSGWSADYPDPHDWLSLQWGSDALNNNVHYRNSRFDSLVETADVTADGGQRMNLYNAGQQILVDDAAWIPLYIPHRTVYIRPAVKNLLVTGYGMIPRGGNWANVGIALTTTKRGRSS